MAMTKDDVLYGLRNIATGDEEETKIADVEDLSNEVLRLIGAGEYFKAYDQAIRESGIKVTLKECEEWVLDNGFADNYEEMAAFARNMMAEQYTIWFDTMVSNDLHVIDGIRYTYVIDEGFSPSWGEQLQEAFGEDYHGPFYVYDTLEEVSKIVSEGELVEEQILACQYPQDGLL